ncbi:MAG: adenylosuccinate lyase [Candidatus Omnitrophica bacterium]|nr:adenylosuccinate lyase [Candidatus Omnitrophota bacterium]
MIERYTRKTMGAIWTDEAKFQKWLDVEIAACEALAYYGIIPKRIPTIVKRKAKFNVQRIKNIEKKVKHDVIAFLTNVAEHVGPESRFIHYGLTSSDVLDTAFALQIKDASSLLMDDITGLISVLGKKAKKYKTTLMMGRSHGIHAEPITFGWKMAVFYEEFKRNRDRLKRAITNISYGKISGAVGTFSNIEPKVEQFVCRTLGLKPEPISTQVVQRDRHAEYLSTLAVIAGSLEKLATEIRHLQRTEVREVEEYFSKGQKGSSAMPHKRNPITCERVSGLARVIRGNAFASIENIALWHERDISHSSVERIIFPDSTILLDYMMALMKDVISDLCVFPERMMHNLKLNKGMIFSQGLMLRLIKKGITRERAYALVQWCAKKTWDDNVDLLDSVLGSKDIRQLLSEKEIKAAFDYNYYIRNVNKIFKRLKL